MTEQKKPRRAPVGPDRERDADRSREKIVTAALAEFAEHGFAGARVSRIAERAGVNKQLISYYFGGKEGLFAELSRRWREQEAAIADPELPLPELVAGYVRTSVTHRDWARLQLWNALTGAEGDADGVRYALADLRRRQAAGELPADLDPGCVLLALTAAASAGVTQPQLVAALGADPGSAEFAEHYAEQLARLVRHLSGQ